MKRIVLGLSLFLILVQNGFASDNSYKETKWFEKVIACERTAMSKETVETATVEYCLDVIEILKNKNNRTDNEQTYLAESYYNAGVIYEGPNYNKHELAVEMYQKAIKAGSCRFDNQCNVKLNLGIKYFIGQGVSENHKKTYELFKDALQHGHPNAQQALKILCSTSPWVCKQ